MSDDEPKDESTDDSEKETGAQPTEGDQPAEQSDGQPAEQADQSEQQPEEQPTGSDQPVEQAEEQPAESDQPADQSDEQPAESDQPAEQAEEQPADSDQPAEPSEEQPAESDQSAATASTDNTVALAGGDAPPSGGGGGGSGGSQPSKDVVVKNERAPADPLPANFVPKGSVKTHRVSDGEDWASVAKKYNVDVKALIYFNFQTNNPDEVNWYLRRNTGCNVSKDGGVNWAFSSSAYPGFIYIPPSEVISMEPEEVTVDTRTIMERLQEIAKTITGTEGIRIREIIDIAVRAGSPGDEQLWYYNGLAALHYIQLETQPSERREMTKDTNGQFPFDGNAGVKFGMWKIYPFRDILHFCAVNPNDCSDTYLKNWLINQLDQAHNSWLEMKQRHDQGGGTTEGLVGEFLDHVHDLSESPIHLYYVYQEH